jgi:hypothetical protein
MPLGKTGFDTKWSPATNPSMINMGQVTMIDFQLVADIFGLDIGG